MGLNYFAKLKKSTMYYHFRIMCHDRRAFYLFQDKEKLKVKTVHLGPVGVIY